MSEQIESGLDAGVLGDHPSRVGRMVILSRVGAGGMGVVYQAYDPRLGRKVALKMIRPDHGARGDLPGRLLQEAYALGKLSDPHVVAVFDVGMLGEHVWLAMEFVQGKTIDAWCRERPRQWREIVDVFAQAARGVAAIHRAELLHRDLKPTNIMIGDDGRVRVMDFGLARGRRLDTMDGDAAGPETAWHELGAMTGTPAYMSPEQLLGGELDGRADQFSLCVALWEALYGQLPSAVGSPSVQRASILSGRRVPPPRSKPVPRWLSRVVTRGLAPKREQRYPSMDDLVRALETDPTRRRRWRIFAVFCGLLVLCAAVWTLRERRHEQQRVRACQDAGAVIDELWNDGRRASLREGLLRSGASFAATTADRVMPRIDAYTRAWRDARVEVCRRETVERDWRAELAEAAKTCLDEHWQQLDSLLEILSRPGVGTDAQGVVQLAVMSVARLPDVELCHNEARLLSRHTQPADPRLRHEIRRLRGVLIRAEALGRINRDEEALALAEAAQREAERLHWAPLAAVAALQRGTLLATLARHAEARHALMQAFTTPGLVGDDDLLVDAAGKLAAVTGYSLDLFEVGLGWGSTARVLRDQARASISDSVEAAVASNIGMVLFDSGNHERAVAEFEQSLAFYERSLGDDHPELVSALNHLAVAEDALGRREDARAHLERAVALAELTQGASHPDLPAVLVNLGNIEQASGHLDEARACLERALTLEVTLRPEHPLTAASHSNLADVLDELELHDLAIAHHERAVAIYERTMPKSRELGSALNNLSASYSRQGRHDRSLTAGKRALAVFRVVPALDERNLAIIHDSIGRSCQELGHQDCAIEHFTSALVIHEKMLPSDDLQIARIASRLGNVYLERYDYTAAIAQHIRALAIFEEAGDPDRVSPLAGLGLAYESLNDFAAARPYLEQALALLEQDGAAPFELAEQRFALARALWRERDQRPRARELAALARDDYRRAGPEFLEPLAAVQRWLRARGG